jgi:hypothetical protein
VKFNVGHEQIRESWRRKFCIDVTFEMRTVCFTNAFIQLMIFKRSNHLFISERKRGREGKIEERQREIEGERACVGEQRMWRLL